MGNPVGVAELKNKTSKVLRRVRTGKEEVVITSKHKPIAKLIPLDAPEPSSDETGKWIESLKILHERIAKK